MDYLKRIETPPGIAMGRGEPGYVILRTRFKNKHRMAFVRAALLASQMAGLDTDALDGDEEGQARAMVLVNEMQAAFDDLDRAYSYFVVEWNWLDDETGQPLPPPSKASMNELYDEQLNWLRDQITAITTRTGATEGNRRSTAL